MTLYAVTGDAFARIEDGTVTTALEGSGVQCLTRDPADDGVVYVGGRGSGIWKSDDGGGSWRQLDFPQPDVFSLAVSSADGAVYAGCEPSMLFVSRDGGASWTELSALREIPSAPTWSFPPRPWTSHVRWIAPSPHDAGLLLAGIELGGVMRSEDGGESWADHRPGAQPDCHALAWHPRERGRAYEAGGGGAAWSFDGGNTWMPADEGRDLHYTWALAVDPVDPDCWYVSASTGPFAAHTNRPAEAYVYRWRGEGPWQALDGGLPQPLDSMAYTLTHREGLLFLGLANGTLYESADAGDSWRPLPVENAPPRLLALA
jgi:photosystem II stability/assembly factor-like uncharacterized protein